MSVYIPQFPHHKVGSRIVPRFPTLIPGHSVHDKLVREYGELKFLLGPTDAPWTPGVFDKLKAGLRHFDERNDWLLMMGNPVLMCQTAVEAGDRAETVLRYLQWGNGAYTPIQVTLGWKGLAF